MRPKLLEIEGLQSFRAMQRIDFDSLGETGLFGIFGPTGSGKSTVLDAITFALYGKVKRAERGTQGIINTNMDTAKVSFTFELLKGSSRKTYRVERNYRRKKGSDNSCEPKVARLIEVTAVGEIPVCDKASEVSSSIEELLGLSHDDFTRAVVLPQNSFQEFLMLDNAKKRDMLERIFYLEEYGKQLWEKINGKIARLRSRIDVISGELKGYADATDEALVEAENHMETAVLARNRAEKELKLLETRYNEAKEVWQHVRDLIVVNQREMQHAASKDTINEKRTILEKAVHADGLLEMIYKNKELTIRLNETKRQLNEVLKNLPDVIKDLGETRQKHEEIKTEGAMEQPKLVGLKTRLIDALGIKGEIKALQGKTNNLQSLAAKLKEGIGSKNEEINKGKEELEAFEQSLGSLSWEMKALVIDPEYRQQIQAGAKLESEVEALTINANELVNKTTGLNDTVAALDQKLNQAKEGISSFQKALEEMGAEKQKHQALLPEDRDSVLRFKEEIHTLQKVFDVLKLRKAELDGMSSKIAKQELSLQELAINVGTLEENKEKSRGLYEKSRLELEHAVREMDRNTAYLLAKNLQEGIPCPVCGSEHHPNPAAQAEENDLAELEQQVEHARKRLTDAEKAFKEAEKDALVAGEQVKAFTLQHNQIVQEMESKVIEYNAEKLRLPDELRSLEPEEIRLELEKMIAISVERLKAIETWEGKQEEYQAGLQKLNDQLVKDKLMENGILTELKVNRESLGQLEQTLGVANTKLNEKQQEYWEFLQKHQVDGAAYELKRLTEKDRKASLLQQQVEQTQELFEKKKAILEQSKEEVRTLNHESIKVQADISSLSAQKNEKELKLKELAGDTCIEDEIKVIDEKLEEYIKLEKQYQERLQAVEKQYHEQVTRKSTLENQQGIYSENLKKEEGLLEASLLDKGFTGMDEVEKAIVPQERQTILKEEINEYDQLGMNIKAQKEIVLKKLNSRSITEEEWNRTSTSYQELAGYKEECVSRSEVAKNNFNTLQNKHVKWTELNRTHNELANKHGLFDQIQKLLRAERGKDNSFIDYIAEERLRYVAAKASETLGVMTKFKYALELDTDAGFIIRDNANGGVHRLVTSLSGGETFLTSLSLALALSEQIQLKGQSPLEFFFLDEGFGTLDNNLLDTVIDSLERLSNKERVIGLISHVPELRSRIARRLIVDPPTSQGDGSMVRIERA
ncbi:MAG: AAA family ATPase [Clostridia bacterium]|nr:AAA family ATPase [Clostridia bacterium]